MKNSVLFWALATIALGTGLGAGIKSASAVNLSCLAACTSDKNQCFREIGDKSACYSAYVACRRTCY